MIGRSAYKQPFRWINIDNTFYGQKTKTKKVSQIILNLIPYIEKCLKEESTTWNICKHLIYLIEGIPNAKKWRNYITTESISKKLTIKKLIELTLEIKKLGY